MLLSETLGIHMDNKYFFLPTVLDLVQGSEQLRQFVAQNCELDYCVLLIGLPEMAAVCSGSVPSDPEVLKCYRKKSLF